MLPIEAQRVQVKCIVETSGVKGRTAAWLLDSGWGNSFLKDLVRWLPIGAREDLEYESEEMKL